MFELTNAQRKCFALPLVLDTWEKVEVKPSPCDMFYTYAYLDGNRIVKVIQVYDEPGQELYSEFSVDQTLSEDKTMILPKTEKGKPQKFTSANLLNKTPIGMSLCYSRGSVSVNNNNSDQSYYNSVYDDVKIESFADFEKWLHNWCKTTGEKELTEINEFAARTKKHQKFKEGDFFRFRINRSLYGYGRIILNFDKMHKDGIAFWDIFMGKPLCVAVYHVATEDKNLTPECLAEKKMLPSQMIMDNIFFYGECEIIGNMPIAESDKDYPIHYGQSIDRRCPDCVHYQCGKVFVTSKNETALYDFKNHGVGWNLDVKLPILLECIKQNSNDPYWDMIQPWRANCDLRNPKFQEELKQIQKQMGID